MPKKDDVIDLKNIAGGMLKLMNKKNMEGSALFDKCWWQHNFNHSNMSQQCKNEYSNASMRKQLLGFGKMKGGSFNKLQQKDIDAISHFLMHHVGIPNRRRFITLFNTFVIPNSLTIRNNLLTVIPEFNAIKNRIAGLMQILQLTQDLPNIHQRLEEIIVMIEDIENELEEPSIGNTDSDEEQIGAGKKSKKKMKGGVFNALNQQQRNETIEQLNEHFHEGAIEEDNIIEHLNNFYFPNSTDVQNNINEIDDEEMLEYLYGIMNDLAIFANIGRLREILEMFRKKLNHFHLLRSGAFG